MKTLHGSIAYEKSVLFFPAGHEARTADGMLSPSVTRLVITALIVWLIIVILLSGPFLRPGELPEDQVWLRSMDDVAMPVPPLTASTLPQAPAGWFTRHLHPSSTGVICMANGFSCPKIMANICGWWPSLDVPPRLAGVYVIARLNRAIDELEGVKRSNAQLRLFVEALTKGKPIQASTVCLTAPPTDYEVYRRKAEDDIRELWFFARAQLNKMINKAKGADKVTLKFIRDGIYERQMSALINMEAMRSRDGYEEWRAKESQALSQAVRDRIRALQNPTDCATAKKILCNLNKGCGYGCQIHHAAYCLVMSISMKRTLVLKSKGWRYNKRGFEDVFLPVSNSCLTTSDDHVLKYPAPDDVLDIELPVIDSINPKPIQLPLALPKGLAQRVKQLHGNPALWWISQLVSFLQRPQKKIKNFLEQVENSTGLKRPYVGIHVRRTDKIGSEASYHSIEEYMSWAIEFFDRHEMARGPLDRRRVYIASDDASVLRDARSQFPDYEFFGDAKIAASASVTSRFHSLDDIFYYGGQKDHNVVAVLNNPSNSENEQIGFVKGDILGIAGNHWDGFSRGVNRRTGERGLFPSFKTVEFVDAIDFGDF
ncbi:hypothetical protein BIW11_00821 [Tropilaelaps mercedesae]|uniref:GT23 domain-containing protein n=1 Tax=Tropilaelaps mercedesae TaxID=418985 RepID=A0A1V9XNQ4_9ACAR|nr:hypothetical protein BIW11_00821 [Tropilaelaps mercedesae]